MNPLKDLVERRRQVAGAGSNRLAGLTGGPEEAKPPAVDGNPVGVALSGGGIRSATFCFGLLQSFAKSGFLSRVDLLSTVSGGSYIGSMVGSLYSRAASRDEANAVTEALGNARSKWFTWWLRANGRYLIPRGTKDSMFAGALYMRNLLGVHFELALIALMLGVLLAVCDLGTWSLVADTVYDEGVGRYAMALMRHIPPWLPSISVLFLPLALAAIVLSTSYWCLPWVAGSRRIKTLQPLLGTVAGVALGMFVVSHRPAPLNPWLELQQSQTGQLAQWTLWALALLLVVSWVLALGFLYLMLQFTRQDGDIPWIARSARSRVTRWLSFCLQLMAAVLVMALVHRTAWYLAFEFKVVGVAGIALAVAAAVLRAALPSAGGLAPGRPSTHLLLTFGRGAGYLLAFLLVAWWVSLVYRAGLSVLFRKTADTPYLQALQALLIIATPVAAYLLFTGRNFDFLNLSSLHGFYRARLSRSYLGAANPRRFEFEGLKDLLADVPPAMRTSKKVTAIGDLEPNDDPEFGAYLPQRNGGPVHLINVCVNQTRDPRGGLFNQDRRGQLLTVASGGLHRVSQGRWEPLPHAGNLTLGAWMAISGAAVAPGLGNLTRGGISALATFAGVRLGYWWQREPLTKLQGLLPWNWFIKSSGLLRETLGIFQGTDQRDWFLTDGGHFENTGAYALLAERARLIIVADCGADPEYGFGDLENLVRKARIDLQVEITFKRPRLPAGPSTEPPPPWNAFGGLHELSSARSGACLALAHIRYGGTQCGEGLMVIIKPALCDGLPVDLLNFKVDNPKFPQEATADQFFSEAQWDAYFELGSFIGSQLSADLLEPTAAVLDWFEDDHSNLEAVSVHAGDRSFINALARGPARLATMSAAGATLSLGAATTIGVSAWQAIDSVRNEAAKKADDERKALAEVAAAWGKLNETLPSTEATPASDPDAAASSANSTVVATRADLAKLSLPEVAAGTRAASGPALGAASAPDASGVAAMATIIVRTADTLCQGDQAAWFTRSVIANQAYNDTIWHCRSLPHPRPAACKMLLEANHPHLLRKLPDCLVPDVVLDPRDAMRSPRNWYYDYSRSAEASEAHPCDPDVALRTRAEATLLTADGDRLFDEVGDFIKVAAKSGGAIRPEGCVRRLADPAAKQALASAIAATQGASLSGPAASVPDMPVESVPRIPLHLLPCAEVRGLPILVQIYGPGGRDAADAWRDRLSIIGLDVPPAQDVVAAARVAGRVDPVPVAQSSIRSTGSPVAQKCAAGLAADLGLPAKSVQVLGGSLRSGSEVVEVWLAPSGLPPPTKASGSEDRAVEYSDRVARLVGPDRRAVAAELSSIGEPERDKVVVALIGAIRKPDDPWSYRQNLYIAYTLSKMSGGWRGDAQQIGAIRSLRGTLNYLDPTFRNRVDAALALAVPVTR
jgi:hypothetical protein